MGKDHVEVIEMDICRSPQDNVLLPETRERCIELVKSCDITLITPPCSTFSRAPWSNSWGPAPIRNMAYPLGFPWLSHDGRRKADEANAMVDLTFEVLELIHIEAQTRFCVGFTEHPKDLGATIPGDVTTRVASIWQDVRATSLVD